MAEKHCNGCMQEELGAYEVALAFAERTTVRLWIVIIALIVLLVGTNIGWLVYESQFETVSEEDYYKVDQDTDEGSNYSIIGKGDINGAPND